MVDKVKRDKETVQASGKSCLRAAMNAFQGKERRMSKNFRKIKEQTRQSDFGGGVVMQEKEQSPWSQQGGFPCWGTDNRPKESRECAIADQGEDSTHEEGLSSRLASGET